jgi:hypothetical protein
MFIVQAPVIIVPTTEVRHLLGVHVQPAGRAAWLEIARRGKGIELAHFQIVYNNVTLAISSRLRADGIIEIEIGVGDPRQAARVIPVSDLRKAEDKLHGARRRGDRPYWNLQSLA